jgi:hypothetical protein
MSSGGGPPILGAYAVVRNLLRTGRGSKETAARAALDAEELRDVEYATMGMTAPEHQPVPSAWTRLLRRLHGG